MTTTLGKWEGVVLNAIAPLYKGTITRKELEYSDWTRHPIPVSDAPLGEKVGILIGGTNNMATAQQMGISWEAKDPDGVVIDSYDAWEMWPYTSPGAEHQFAEIAGQFYLDKVGTYTLELDLLMNRADPVIVDSYSGVLCTTTTEVPPTFVLLEETIYPYAYIYDGPCDVATFTATSIPFTPASWVSGKMAADVEKKVREAGGRIMEMRIYVDESLWRPWTYWKIEVVTRPETGVAMSLSGVWWLGLAIILALSAIIIIVTPWAISTIMALFKRKPELEDVKPGWGKETLILTIQDSEDYWKRTPTPIETLEAMSEAELRGYLDKIAEEEVPTKPSIWPWVIGGVAALGVGVIAVKAMSKKK